MMVMFRITASAVFSSAINASIVHVFRVSTYLGNGVKDILDAKLPFRAYGGVSMTIGRTSDGMSTIW